MFVKYENVWLFYRVIYLLLSIRNKIKGQAISLQFDKLTAVILILI
ncbi:hypothetical protein ECDEC6B_3868 [Escherichia coli DEC6B]|nr:hypothetical protein ECDEC6B_3868 [Escherichia coli DEC6B]